MESAELFLSDVLETEKTMILTSLYTTDDNSR
jgi:hypothetical protein